MSQVDVEIGRTPDALIYLGEPEVRDLADVPTGQIFLSNLYGKSFEFPVYGPGDYLFTVPPYVYTINILKMVAGGGGGSGTNGAGDIWGGGGGGSGGYLLNSSFAVTPGQELMFHVGYGGESGRVTFNGPVLCAGTSGSTSGTNGQPTWIEKLDGGIWYEVASVGGGIAGTPAPNGDNGPGAPGAGGSPNGVSGGYQSPIQRNSFSPGPGGNNGTGYGGGGNGNGMSPLLCPGKGGNGYLSISWTPAPAPLTGTQSNASCYSAQGGFSVDTYTVGGVASTYLTMGVWPTDPPNCQTCDWHWLIAGGTGVSGLSNDSSSNIYRANNNIRPYWSYVWQVNISNMNIGQTVYTQAPNWPYTLVSYTYAVTRTGAKSISIVPYPNAWGTGDTGTSISVNNWWRNVVYLGGGDPDYGPLGSINLSWT